MSGRRAKRRAEHPAVEEATRLHSSACTAHNRAKKDSAASPEQLAASEARRAALLGHLRAIRTWVRAGADQATRPETPAGAEVEAPVQRIVRELPAPRVQVAARPPVQAASPRVPAHERRANDGASKAVAATLLPIALVGAVGGCMRLYGALEPAWHTTALAACVIPLALEAGGAHFGREAVKARAWVALLVCVATVFMAGGIDILAGKLGPQIAYRQHAGTILGDAAAQLASEHRAQQHSPPVDGDGRNGPQTRLALAQFATEAVRQQGSRDEQLQALTTKRLEVAKPAEGEGLLTVAVTLGGSLCGVMLPLLLAELLARGRRPVEERTSAAQESRCAAPPTPTDHLPLALEAAPDPPPEPWGGLLLNLPLRAWRRVTGARGTS